MAYTVITKPTLGDAIKKSLVDDLIDNSDYLFDNLGGGNLVENGSFEQGNSPNDPTGWVSSKWGTGAIETTDPGHGKQGYKFTSVGSGGGYLTMQDFAECSEHQPLFISWFMKSSVVDIKNIVRILWYKKDQTACATASHDLYSEAAANPTSWEEKSAAVVPPADARYFKLRLIGADSSDATAGSCIFDGVRAVPYDGQTILPLGTIAENTTTSPTFVDCGSVSFELPQNLPATAAVSIRFQGSLKGPDGINIVSQRFRIGTEYSNVAATVSNAYVVVPYEIVHLGPGGTVTLYQQLGCENGYVATGKKDVAYISVSIINWK